MSKELGFVQGRLLQPPHGELQWFPQDNWEHEFSVASSIGADYIELIVEREINADNPVWTDSGIEKLLQLSRRVDFTFPALCNDFVISHNIFSERVLDQNTTLIERAALLGIRNFVLPLFEESNITIDNYIEFLAPLRYLADIAREYQIVVCLESNLPGIDLFQLLNDLKRDNVATVFDTGNRIAEGHDLASDIALLGENIKHVHLKDKDSNGDNVLLGTGLVNFLDVFVTLQRINYCGAYTFETTRGTNPVRTAQYNLSFARFFLHEASKL